MRKRFRIVALILVLAGFPVGMSAAESPEGDFVAVESAGASESAEAPVLLSPASSPESPAHAATRAELLAQVEATDPTAWLLRFGAVEKRPRVTREP